MARAVVLFVTTAALCLTHTSGAGIIPAFSRPPMFALRQHAALSPVRGGRGDRPRTKSPAMSSAKIEFEDPVAPEPGCYSNVLVIGVAGGSGGGKSVFCSKLEDLVNKICPTIVLSHDSYYKNKGDVDSECGGNWDCPEALHTRELVADLNRLRAGEVVDVPVYDFAANARSPNGGVKQQFQPGTRGVLLVEGLMS
ncbi:hypothetical protein T484DRAFT_1771912, partial [Baffinella frigidus]